MSESPAVDQPVVIPRRVDYFEVGVFAYSSLYGVVTLVNYTDLASRAVKIYPGIGGVVFLALLVVGGVTGLASFAYKTVTGPKLELASLTLLVILCITYGLWSLVSIGTQGVGLLLSMTLLIAFPGAFARKRLAKYVRDLEAIVKKQRMGGRESETGDAVDAVDSSNFRGRRWWQVSVRRRHGPLPEQKEQDG